VPELVGHIAEPHAASELRRLGESQAQVPDQRLPRDQPFVGQHVPRPDHQAPLADPLCHALAGAWTHLEIVVEGHHLPVQGEAAEVGIALQQVEESVEQAYQPVPELLVAAVPLAVPMGVRNDDEMARGRALHGIEARPRSGRPKQDPSA
jgi:hypothetical protein